jgi:hypothetical protein
MSVSLLIEVVEDGAWVPRARTFNTDEDFKLDENNIDGEACAVGQLLLHYGDAMSELKAEVARKKEVVDRIHAVLFAQAKATDVKATVDAIKASIVSDPQYQGARNDLLSSEANFIRVETWYRSLNKKIDCLVMIGYKQRKEIQHSGYAG